MSILADHQIATLARAGMIAPFVPEAVRQVDGRPVVSFGLSSYGYDARVADEWLLFTDRREVQEVDPKDFDKRACFRKAGDGSLLMPPHSFALARTVERFKIPRDVLALCYAKSTYARCGVVVGVTPLEPQWEGHVTLEFSNTTPLPVRIHANEGVCQFVFLMADQPCAVSYADRGGKYQNQVGVVLPRV